MGRGGPGALIGTRHHREEAPRLAIRHRPAFTDRYARRLLAMIASEHENGIGGVAADRPSDLACARAVGNRVRKRTEHAAADSPQAPESPDRRTDGWNASG